ncbi:MAG: tetratricopeptide repeat protein [Magnetococcales bacterium]|nr:tetratricopeptide repeat protein [Magnetococcales bacterium]
MPDADPFSPISAADLATARAYHQQGALDQAWALYERLRSAAPDHPDLLHLTSLICIRQGNFAQAIERIQRARAFVPDNPILCHNEGLSWIKLARWEEARQALQEAIRLKPDYVNAHCQLGRVLIQQNRAREALTILGQAVRLQPERAEIHSLLATALYAMEMPAAAHYRRRLAHYYENGSNPADLSPQHTFFLDRQRAADVARQGNSIQESIQTKGVQVCYYAGEPLADGVANLIAVPTDPQEAETFFCFTTLSLPVEIDFDPAIAAERLAGSRIAALLNRVRLARVREVQRLAAECRATPPPPFHPDQPLRVYLPASRHGDVLMYNARDLAAGFRRLGCEVLYFVESSPTETFYFHHWLQAQLRFRPHIVLDINNAFNIASQFSFQSHPDLFRILWFQDPSPAIVEGHPIPWRPRDLIYSISKEFDPMLQRSGARTVQRQGFCYDEDIFKDFGYPRENGVVLVASSHNFVLHHFAGCEPLLAQMEAMFEAGEPMTEAVLDRFAAQFPYSRSDIFIFLWGYVVRNVSARWLCSLADEIQVAVYGHRWAGNPAVEPFYRGVLPHGPAVAEVYNRVRYVLVSHPFDLQSQRLAEVSACGAVPIVYDCRHRVDPPHWDDHCLWYRTREELRACLTRMPLASPSQICQGRSYTAFAQKILAHVSQIQGDQPPLLR